MSRRDHPWSKFWWEDYERDDGLELCSLAAQGLWMRMLCKMHVAEDRGYLTINGVPVSCETLAKLVRVRREKCAKLLQELEKNRVFSRDENDTIYCRRMVREKENQEVARLNGSRGGNPALVKGLTPPVRDELKLQEAKKLEAKKLEEREEPKATPLGAGAPVQPPTVRDPAKEFFEQAAPLVISLTGMSRSAAGGFLVKLVRRANDNREHVLDALRSADERRPLQPQGWLMEAVEARARSQGKLDWVMDEYARMGDIH